MVKYNYLIINKKMDESLNYNFENKEIYYFDKSGNKEILGIIKSVDNDFDQIEIEFSKFGKALYKNINNPIGISEALRIFKNNKNVADVPDMESLLIETDLNSKNGIGNIIIGELPNKIKLENIITDDNSLSNMFNYEAFNKRNVNFNAIKLFKDGLDIKGKHVFIKASNSKESENMLYMEYEALKTLKKNGVNVPDVELKIIDNKPFLIMERFDKKSDFTVEKKGSNFYTNKDSGVYNSSQLFTIKDIVKNTAKVDYEYQLTDQSYLIALNFVNKLHESKDESTKEFLDISNKKNKKEIFKVLSFNLMIGNNDMHGDNIGFVLNSKVNSLNGNIDYKLAPFYDITPHRFYTNENSIFKNSSNDLKLEDLKGTSYRGLIENKDFIAGFEEAKVMFNDYKKSLEKRFENKSEQLNSIKEYFQKKY